MGTKTKKTRRGRDKMIMTKNQIIRPNKASKSCKGGSPIGLNPKTCSSRRGQGSGTSRSPHGVNDAMGAKGLWTESLVGSVRKTRFGGQAAVSSGPKMIIRMFLISLVGTAFGMKNMPRLGYETDGNLVTKIQNLHNRPGTHQAKIFLSYAIDVAEYYGRISSVQGVFPGTPVDFDIENGVMKYNNNGCQAPKMISISTWCLRNGILKKDNSGALIFKKKEEKEFFGEVREAPRNNFVGPTLAELVKRNLNPLSYKTGVEESSIENLMLFILKEKQTYGDVHQKYLATPKSIF